MNEKQKNDPFRARKHCNNFRFIDYLNSMNNGGEFEITHYNIFSKELKLDKEKQIMKLFVFWI